MRARILIAGGLLITCLVQAEISVPTQFTHFSSADYPELRQIELSFYYPTDWEVTMSESDLTFLELADGGFPAEMICYFMLIDGGGPFFPDQVKATPSPETLQGAMPPGANELRSFPSTVDGIAAGSIDYSANLPVKDNDMNVRWIGRTTMVVFEREIFNFSCGVRALENEPVNWQMSIFDQHAGVFDRMQRGMKVKIPRIIDE